jgi:uncharacterized membrane protein YtjA (UPF0391 family)
MVTWALVFFISAFISALFGFGGVAPAAADVGKVMFFAFAVLAATAVVVNVMRGRPALWSGRTATR